MTSAAHGLGNWNGANRRKTMCRYVIQVPLISSYKNKQNAFKERPQSLKLRKKRTPEPKKDNLLSKNQTLLKCSCPSLDDTEP